MLRRFLACSFVALAAGCSSAPTQSAPTQSTTSAIIKGTESDYTQDEVILLISVDGGFGSCSGTLIAPNLVLTARHCVTNTNSQPFACDVKGNLVQYSGTQVGSDHPPNTMLVFTGRNRPMFGMMGNAKVAARGIKLFHDGAKVLCSHDLALVLLDKDIPDAKIAPIRLDGEILAGETFTAVGWGVTDETPSPSVRQQREGISVVAVGPDAVGQPTPPNDFKVGESICSGDSGGPALATDTKAVIGVVSRGGNGSMTSDPSAGCIKATNFYASTVAFRDLILDAFAESGHEPWLEGQPDPRLAKFGEACAQDDECRSSVCATHKGASTCSEDCSADPTVCPMGYECKTDGARKVCLPYEPPPPPPPPPVGCSASGSSGATSAGLLALALAWLARRRRQR